MGIRDESDTAGATAAKLALQQAAHRRSVEDEIELNAIEDDAVRQILKIPPRHKLHRLA